MVDLTRKGRVGPKLSLVIETLVFHSIFCNKVVVFDQDTVRAQGININPQAVVRGIQSSIKLIGFMPTLRNKSNVVFVEFLH